MTLTISINPIQPSIFGSIFTPGVVVVVMVVVVVGVPKMVEIPKTIPTNGLTKSYFFSGRL